MTVHYSLFFSNTSFRFLWYHRCVAITSSQYHWAPAVYGLIKGVIIRSAEPLKDAVCDATTVLNNKW